ncbi:MAG: hypothetical protein QXT45_08220 [Candidatus Bilamarchaeaceae archaeon]
MKVIKSTYFTHKTYCGGQSGSVSMLMNKDRISVTSEQLVCFVSTCNAEEIPNVDTRWGVVRVCEDGVLIVWPKEKTCK